MKKFIFTSVFVLLLLGGSGFSAQNNQKEYIGLPGDNLNLFAVMTLFQDSETLEAFERSLNDPEVMVNNLDLNGDNYVDYIMVHDYVDGSVHNIVLRVALNLNEFQDVAVFTVEKFRNGSVQVQLIGDEALYGPNYIIEPNYAERSNPGYRGNVVQQQASASQNVTVVRTTYHEVARWPVIVYISRPAYRPWRSSWYWGYTPSYWNPWTPHYYHYYYGYHHNWNPHYHTYYRTWHHPRSVGYSTIYYTHIRNYSPTVVVNVNKGAYQNTYSRPDKKSEGEVLYTQRKAVGTRVPSSSSNEATREQVSRSAAATTRDNDKSVNPTPTGRRVATPQSNETNATREAPASRSGSERASTTPARPATTTAPRSATQPSRQQVATPDKSVSPPATERATTTPSRPATTTTRPATTTTRPVETTTRPAATTTRSSETTTRPAATTTRSSETTTRPAATTTRPSAPASRPQATTPSQTRESAPAPARTVQQPSSGSNSSETRSAPAPSRSSSQPAANVRAPRESSSSREE